MELTDLRARIDRIDGELTGLLVERLDTVAQVARYKQEKNLPVLDTGRERDIVNRVTAQAGPDYENALRLVYNLLFDISRSREAALMGASGDLSRQMDEAVSRCRDRITNRSLVACQGTEGAYSQKICQRMFDFPTILYMRSFDDVFAAVEKGMCPYGILPIENSTAGSVTQVYDLMEKHRFHIVRAARQRIEHVLWARPGASLAGITEVVSHEQALRQCSGFFARHPAVKAVPMENTARAAEYVAASGRCDLAAIASQDCGQLYSLQALDRDVSDAQNNYTRFICIARDMEIYRSANKISVMLRAEHRPGSLYRLLSYINALGVNLTKLESRPMPGREFEFRFFFDLEGSLLDGDMRMLMGQLSAHSDQFTLLGNYEELK